MLAQEARACIPLGSTVAGMISRALVRMMGPADAEALEFYVDTRLAVEDPLAYEKSLRLLLGEHGGSLVIEGLKTELAKVSGVERSRDSFFGQVRTSERALLRSANARPARALHAQG
ncbi:MAG: DUF3227 domain-containing protein [Thaumarchaeota archaeon]|nr:DUF3227 domain-containing protein [Nitrososphaerota archaeon]